MTVVSPGCDPSTLRRIGARSLVWLLIFSIVWTPWALVWGDDLRRALDFDQAATDGQDLGTALGSDPVLLAPFDQPDDYRIYFLGAEAGDVTDWSVLYGNPEALEAAGLQTQQDLVDTPYADSSATGQAYQTLLAPVERTRSDLSADPLWAFTDATVSSLDDFTATYADCTWDNTFLSRPRTVHVPQYEACLIPDKDQPKLGCTATRTLDATVYWDPVQVGTDPETGEPIIELVRRVEKRVDVWNWASSACQQTVRERVMDGFCRSTTTCTSNPDSDCVPVPGGELCGGELVAPPYLGETGSEPWEQFSGIGAACMQVGVALDCTSFNEGRMDCWTDPDGVTHCPENPGDLNNCAVLDANPQCRRISRQCAEAATGKSGICYVDQVVYDCGTDQVIAGIARTSELDCGGAIRCLGDDCVQIEPESSDDFDEAVAALNAAEMVSLDADCTTGSCQVFQGEARECKRAVGGIVNCCERPSGISLGLYLQLMFSVAKLDSVTMSLMKAGVANPAFGAWETLRSPLVDTWSAVKDAFTSSVNNLTGNTTAVTTEAAKQGLIATFKQQLLQDTVQWTAATFGPQAANTLFIDAATRGVAVGADGTVASQLALQPAITVVIQWVMWAYLVYTIVMILIQLIWECTEDEFTLGVQRELKSCHRVGAYCKKNLFGACIESRDSYCCFHSPLSRILHEQIRGQVGGGYGSAKHPNCAGIPVATLAEIDWSRIDLSEWLVMLTDSDLILTTTGLDLETLTEGQGNRRAKRLEDLREIQTVGGANREAETQGWTETLETLPRAAAPTVP
ncbi:conjugal transfer protein TraN [Thiocystis violascens]|uniref:Mating pair stabilization protein TraN n=1 Tax=Thiocystis violascens (strain ATCC 17096 / DSM 198 / 6111) TaxID=765911 RepID=I3Y930_THIV6|nr:conjugal transfer protein TraN [Thiocystis violascens]AFL73498.1 Mating pair stabilization protein TraN [Thiocystis violascens DSM 198]